MKCNKCGEQHEGDYCVDCERKKLKKDIHRERESNPDRKLYEPV